MIYQSISSGQEGFFSQLIKKIGLALGFIEKNKAYVGKYADFTQHLKPSDISYFDEVTLSWMAPIAKIKTDKALMTQFLTLCKKCSADTYALPYVQEAMKCMKDPSYISKISSEYTATIWKPMVDFIKKNPALGLDFEEEDSILQEVRLFRGIKNTGTSEDSETFSSADTTIKEEGGIVAYYTAWIDAFNSHIDLTEALLRVSKNGVAELEENRDEIVDAYIKGKDTFSAEQKEHINQVFYGLQHTIWHLSVLISFNNATGNTLHNGLQHLVDQYEGFAAENYISFPQVMNMATYEELTQLQFEIVNLPEDTAVLYASEGFTDVVRRSITAITNFIIGQFMKFKGVYRLFKDLKQTELQQYSDRYRMNVLKYLATDCIKCSSFDMPYPRGMQTDYLTASQTLVTLLQKLDMKTRSQAFAEICTSIQESVGSMTLNSTLAGFLASEKEYDQFSKDFTYYSTKCMTDTGGPTTKKYTLLFPTQTSFKDTYDVLMDNDDHLYAVHAVYKNLEQCSTAMDKIQAVLKESSEGLLSKDQLMLLSNGCMMIAKTFDMYGVLCQDYTKLEHNLMECFKELDRADSKNKIN